MNKIKNFKINLNKNTAWRHVNAKLDASEFDDATFNELFSACEEQLAPAAIFDSVSRESGKMDYAPLWADCLTALEKETGEPVKEKQVLAMSFALTRLGDRVENFVAAQSSDRIRQIIAQVLAVYFMDLASALITRAIKEEAQKDDCVTEKRVVLPIDQYGAQLAQLFDINKIGLDASALPNIHPACVNFFCIPWMKKKKK